MGQESLKELKDLLTVHAFYVSLLEKQLGHAVPVPAGISVPQEGQENSPEAAHNLKLWLDLLDMAITPPMVRDGLKRTSNIEAAHALLRYFVTKTSGRAGDRDKTDCVSTYLFRNPAEDSPHKWGRPETDASYYHLAEAALAFEGEIYRALGDVHFDSMPTEHVQLLREFEYFHQELEEFRNFDQIIDSAMVQRVRELKQSLGKSFYHPDSLAHIAVWNDVFGRKFDDLFHNATRQIKTFAEHVQREGGSILTRVEGDITVKHLTELETQQEQILLEDYQNSQDQFRKVSKYKKAVDSKRAPRSTYAPIPPRTAAPEAPRPVIAAPVIPPAAFALQPLAAAVPQASAPVQQPEPRPSLKQGQPEVLAVPPSQAVQNAVHEGKIHSTREMIKNHVRSADAKLAHIVPVKKSKLVLSAAEVEAFRAEYHGEKSFRADYANVIMIMVAYLSRMIVEVDEYNQKATSAYLWKPHADALTYLLSTLQRINMEVEQVKKVAQGRGLQDKVTALEVSLDKLKKYAQTVSQTLQAADQHYSS